VDAALPCTDTTLFSGHENAYELADD